MKIIQALLTKNPYYTAGRKITPQGLMLHSVGCAQPSAEVFTKRWNSEDYTRACIHAFIDANTGDVHQTLPWEYRAPHGGGAVNNTHIGVEMCESSYIKYIGTSDRFTIIDKEKAWAHCTTAYKSAVELFAYLCKKYGLDPIADIISHNEGGKRGIASKHSDPEHYWTQLGIGYTMAGFRQDVKNAMNGKITVTISKKEDNDMGYPVLKKGSKGDDVKMLQKLLIVSGYSCGKAGVDGDFGNGTEEAVEKFQKDFKLTVDGVAGAETFEALVNAPLKVASDMKDEYNALYASADALRTRILNAVETFDKGGS